jgi:hypothetical protein
MPVTAVGEEGAVAFRTHVQMIAFLEKLSTKKSDQSDRSDVSDPSALAFTGSLGHDLP